MKRGIFIVVDGLDGSGKSEIVKMLHNYLFSKHKKYRILTTREPTNGVYGSRIRKMLREEKDPISNSKQIMELFIKDRKKHLKNSIIPFLKKSKDKELNIVLCDRYYYSTIAFQGAQGIQIKDLVVKNKVFLRPDIAFILDVNPSVALKRIEYRKKEKFERQDFMSRIRQNFLELPRLLKDNIKIIDSNRPIRNVFEDIRRHIEKIL